MPWHLIWAAARLKAPVMTPDSVTFLFFLHDSFVQILR